MTKQEFNPLDLKKVAEQVAKKKAEREAQGINQESHRGTLIESQEICGVTIHSYTGYNAPFFLEDMNKVEFNFLDDSNFDLEPLDSGEEWNKEEREQSVEAFKKEVTNSFKKAFDNAAHASQEKPFQIEFSYRTRDTLIKLGLLPSSFEGYSMEAFYLPSNYQSYVNKFNDHALSKTKKSAHEELVKLIDDISLN